MTKSPSLAIWPSAAMVLLAVAFVGGSIIEARFWPSFALLVYAVWTLLASIVAFTMFGWDKRAAQSRRDPPPRRVPERTLHAAAALGGWPGAVFGQQYFRHKSSKLSFRIVLWIIIAVHAALIVAIWYLR